MSVRGLIDTYDIQQRRILWSSPGVIWTHDHCIPFRTTDQLSYPAMKSSRTQSQFCAATPVSSRVQCHISFRLLPSLVVTFFLIEIFRR